jgi:hypothetical protein
MNPGLGWMLGKDTSKNLPNLANRTKLKCLSLDWKYLCAVDNS